MTMMFVMIVVASGCYVVSLLGWDIVIEFFMKHVFTKYCIFIDHKEGVVVEGKKITLSHDCEQSIKF